MRYECEDCGYNTTRKLNFLRHKNRKYSCKHTTYGVKRLETPENTNVKDSVKVGVKVGEDSVKVGVKDSDRSKKDFKMENTNEPIHQCDVCHKIFTTRQGKYEHRKRVKCKPITIPCQQQTINNVTNHNIDNSVHTITNNNLSNCNNQNVQINVFGNEDLSYLLKDNEIIHRLRMYGKEGLYGLPKILDDVHFNNDRPENQTIIKPEEYGNTVLIKNSRNEWEFREFEDVRDNLIDTMIKYIKMYNEVKKNLKIKLIEEKERNFIKKISYELMALDGSIPRDLFYELNMDENKVDENEDSVKNKTRKFDKSTMHMIHNRTYYTYKKENGLYVKK